jgi:hypothetical protein
VAVGQDSFLFLVLNLLMSLKQLDSLHECIEFIHIGLKSFWQLDLYSLLSEFIIETVRQDTCRSWGTLCFYDYRRQLISI